MLRRHRRFAHHMLPGAMLLLGALPAAAQNLPIDAPDPLPPLVSGQPLDAEVTIVRLDRRTMTEYRDRNGHLYMIRVQPDGGAPYVLVDSDGDGELESRSGEYAPATMTPRWTILDW